MTATTLLVVCAAQRILGYALLLAIRQDRVLIEQRVDPTWHHETPDGYSRQKRGHGTQPRWCDRPPYTYQCHYRPWTHCPPPDLAKAAVKTPGNVVTWSKAGADHAAEVVRIKLSWIESQQAMWMQKSDRRQAWAALPAALRFLFRPRAWVEKVVKCVMRSGGLQDHRWSSVHVRNSPEKAKEVKNRYKRTMPEVVHHMDLVSAVSSGLGATHVLLQTASPTALEAMEAFAHRKGYTLSYTNNSRAERDSWGGWSSSNDAAMMGGTVAAVNAHLGAIAPVFLSPALSAWTYFVHSLMPPPAELIPSCCMAKKLASAAPRMPIGTLPPLPTSTTDYLLVSPLARLAQTTRAASFATATRPTFG